MRLQGKTIGVFVAAEVEDLEFWVPVMRLREEGAKVIVIGLSNGWAPDKLRRNQKVLQIVRDMHAQGKIVATICHGGWVPISAGIMRGRKATGSTGIKDDIINAGGTWVNEAAFREGNMVWGRVVEDIPDFCRELVAALAG